MVSIAYFYTDVLKTMSQNQLSIRVPEHELQILDRYSRKTKRTKTDIIREFIRSLEITPKTL